MTLFRFLPRGMAPLMVGLGALLLAACEPSAPPPAEPIADEAGQPDTSIVREVTSIDADGNIAPFGMASREPVPLEDPAVAAPASTATNSGPYTLHCAACHGADALGVEGLGVNLRASELVRDSSQAQLVAFLQAGRAIDDPANTSGVPMPAFAWMDPAQLEEIVVYVNSLPAQ